MSAQSINGAKGAGAAGAIPEHARDEEFDPRGGRALGNGPFFMRDSSLQF